ncbi:sortase [bacterium]|nr:sortase [bacterium]
MNRTPTAALYLFFVLIILTGLFIPIQSFETVFASSDEGIVFQQTVVMDPFINKKFNPTSIPPGGTSRLTVEIFNPNDYALSNVAFVDDLDGIHTGIIIADEPQASTTCNGTVTATPGEAEFSLTGGTVGPKVGPVNGSCSVSVNVTSFVSGNLDNVLEPGDLTAEYTPPGEDTIQYTNPEGATETLNVASLEPAYISKSFTSSSIRATGQSRLRVTIQNRDTTYPLHDVSITDTFPEGLVIPAPTTYSISSNCGPDAELDVTPGATSVTLSNATIAANTSCYFDVNVQAPEEGYYTNTIPVGAVSSYEGVTNDNQRSASLNVTGLTISKQFSDSSILAGEDTSELTITIQNPYGEALTNASLVDDLPDIDLVFVPGTLSTTCETGEAPATLTLTEGDTVLTMSNATIPAGSASFTNVTLGTCEITGTVTAPGNAAGGGSYNTIPADGLTNDQDITNATYARDYITVNPQSIDLYKSFSPRRFEIGGQTTVSIRLTNPTSTDIPNVNLTDELPSQLTPVQPADTSTTCSGTAAVTVDATSITLSDATIPANSSCTFSAVVTTTGEAEPGSYTNSIPAEAITGSGITNQSGESESVTTYPTGLGAYLYKDFSESAPQPTGTNVRLYIRVRAPEDKQLTNVQFVDTFPTGMVVAETGTPYTSNCGAGAITATPGASSFTFSGGTIDAGTTCTVNVYVTSDDPGTYTNTIEPEDLTNDQNQTAPSNDSDSIRFSDFTIAKSFSPDLITWGGKSILTITLTNEDDREMTDVYLQDRLNTMGFNEFVIAPDPDANTTCSGTLTADPGESTITLSGGTIPAASGGLNGSCTISVTIFANENANTSTNAIVPNDAYGSISGVTETIPPRSSTSDKITVEDLEMALVKNFDPSSVSGGASSRMTVLLINPNDVPLSDIAFTDVVPEGMEISEPADVDTSTCGGEVTIAGDLKSFTYSGGYLAAGRRCTISLYATIRVNGNRVNTIPAEAVSTFIGVTNPQPASSTLTNLPGVSVKKYFTPDRILAEPGEYAILTISLNNTSNAPVPNLGLLDDFPTGLVVVDVPGEPPTNTCGGTFAPDAGDGFVELVGGYLEGLNDPPDPDSECFLTVPVTAPIRGMYRNDIQEGLVTSSDENVTNPEPASSSLEVYGTPDMQIVKSVTTTAPYNEDDEITYEIVVTNSGDITLSNVSVTDAGEGAVLGTCTPLLGSSLAPGETMTCAATHVVTAEDITDGQYVNVATATSDKAGPVTDDAEVPMAGGPAISIDKYVTSVGPYSIDDTIDYKIAVTNIGSVNLDNVVVSDLVPDVIMGACDPAEGSTLAAGASMTCTASYVVTQDALDVGEFTNTASVDADQVDPKSDSVTTQLAQFPALAAYKYEMSTGSYAVGDRIEFDIVVQNTGNITLTGVEVSDPGTELPLGPCNLNEDQTPVTLPTTLGLNDVLYCEAYHEVTQEDIDAGEYINTAYAESDQTPTDSATGEVEIDQIPLVTLEKTGFLTLDYVEPPDQADAGDIVYYEFEVTNIGNVTLYDLNITDELVGVQVIGGPIEMLAPGASDSATITASYSLTQDDIDNGFVSNTATVTAYDPNDSAITAQSSDSKSYNAYPSISLVKEGTLNIDVVEPDDRVDVGDTITYTFTVENTGNVTLTDIAITDPNLDISGDPIELAPGGVDDTTFTGTYELTQADIDAGAFTNTATVSGLDPDENDVSNTDSFTQPLERVPGIEIDKSGTLNMDVIPPNDRLDEGDTISYSFVVTNTGNTTLENVGVTDNLITLDPQPSVTLLPGESDTTSFTGTLTLTQAQIDSGSIYNQATAEGDPPAGESVSDSDEHTTPLTPDPDLTLEKTATLHMDVVAPNDQVNVGDTITYVFTITNTGNVSLSNLRVEDPGITVQNSPQEVSLAPGQSNTTITGTYTLTQSDIDSGFYENTATARAETPEENDITDDDTENVDLGGEPSIALEKTGSTLDDHAPLGMVNAGDHLTYAFSVENTGNVTLHNVVVTDDNPDVTLTGCTISQLAVGETNSTDCTGVYTLTQADLDEGTVDNSASVAALDPQDETVTDTANETVTIDPDTNLGVNKTIISGPTKVAAGTWQVTYQITLTNMGNVTLDEIKIQDDLKQTFPDPIVFAVLEVSSTDFTVNWPGYTGEPAPAGDTNLLAGDIDVLTPGESGSLTVTVEFVPTQGGPYKNLAIGGATSPKDQIVTDDSQDGLNPDPDEDNDPGNNSDPTNIIFGSELFDPPVGIKAFNNAGFPVLEWSVTWINSKNVVPVKAAMSDPIPEGLTFISEGDPNGYALPAGTLPSGTTNIGVDCVPDAGSTDTTTTYCYYEGPTVAYPQGRIVWEGVLGPDQGASNAEQAQNEIVVIYATEARSGLKSVRNTAMLDVDLNGDSEIAGLEEGVVSASEDWEADRLPDTGFIPGLVTRIPEQPTSKAYAATNMTIEIPALDISTSVVTIPFADGTWDVTWLGNQVGYLEGSAFPTWTGNTVLTAHVTTPYDTPGLFADLSSLSYGDQILIHAYGRTYTYEMRSRRIVNSTDFNTAFKQERLDWITLMTCTGFDAESGVYAYRHLVRAVLVDVD